MNPLRWSKTDTQALEDLLKAHKVPKVSPWIKTLPGTLQEILDPKTHGDLPLWQDAIANLPTLKTRDHDFARPVVQIGPSQAHDLQQAHIAKSLKALMPWRKGPFEVFGLKLDAEWRCDLKWQRFADQIHLKNHRVLDVGCGNGYYALRMLGAGAKVVVGVDPTVRFWLQWAALAQFFEEEIPFYFLPLPLEGLPEQLPCFDTVFSMGVLYHRRNPLAHLESLKAKLAPGGQVILETLIVEGDEQTCLIPQKRYAQMRNVWFLPSRPMFELWCRRLGFKQVQFLDQSPTTIAEQRVTEWMTFQSLDDFLDPNDKRKTIEGYPAPLRATWCLKLS